MRKKYVIKKADEPVYVRWDTEPGFKKGQFSWVDTKEEATVLSGMRHFQAIARLHQYGYRLRYEEV